MLCFLISSVEFPLVTISRFGSSSWKLELFCEKRKTLSECVGELPKKLDAKTVPYTCFVSVDSVASRIDEVEQLRERVQKEEQLTKEAVEKRNRVVEERVLPSSKQLAAKGFKRGSEGRSDT